MGFDQLADEVLVLIFEFLPRLNDVEHRRSLSTRKRKIQWIDDPCKNLSDYPWASALLVCQRFLSVGRDVFDPWRGGNHVLIRFGERAKRFPHKMDNMLRFKKANISRLILLYVQTNQSIPFQHLLLKAPFYNYLEEVSSLLIAHAVSYGADHVLHYMWSRSGCEFPTPKNLIDAIANKQLPSLETIIDVYSHYTCNSVPGNHSVWQNPLQREFEAQHRLLEAFLHTIMSQLNALLFKHGLLSPFVPVVDDDGEGLDVEEPPSDNSDEDEDDAPDDPDLEHEHYRWLAVYQDEDYVWDHFKGALRDDKEDLVELCRIEDHINTTRSMIELLDSVI